MWFFFGFITLLSFSVYAGYKRINSGWKGIPGRIPGLDHQYLVVRNKKRIARLMIGIKGPDGYDFLLKRESWLDRASKFLGLSVEHQIGNPTFDNLVYIVSDDRALHLQLDEETALADSVIQLFAICAEFNCRLKQIRCNSGRLWIVAGIEKGFDEGEIHKLCDNVALVLQELGKHVRKFPLPQGRKWRDPFVLRAIVILAISTGLFINGIIHITRLFWSGLPWTLDWQPLLIYAAGGAGVLVAILALAAVFFLGRSARTHLVLVELCLIGYVGAAATFFIELRDLNMDFDAAPGIEYRTQTRHKYIQRSRRGPTRYYLDLEDWTGETDERKVAVSRDFYEQVSVGDVVLVTQKPGFLASRWVERIAPPAPETLW